MTVKFHEVDQGSPEWIRARCGVLTASEMKLIITPKTLKAASNDKEKTHLFELLAQRITEYVEPQYWSDDMLRGVSDEIDAKALYAQHYEPTADVGFVTNDKWGFTIGYSPDALVGSDGQIECKSRRQKYQMETILSGKMPEDYLIQVQTGLLVTERKWCDFVSYCAGMPMMTLRIYPDPEIQQAIIAVAMGFSQRLNEGVKAWADKLCNSVNRLIPTERKPENNGEMTA